MTDQTEIHNLADPNAPVVAAMRTAYAPGKGVTLGPEARPAFDAMIAITPVSQRTVQRHAER